MVFWQVITFFNFFIGLVNGIVALASYLFDVKNLKHRHKILLICLPLAVIFIMGGVASWIFGPALLNTPTAQSHSSQTINNSPTATRAISVASATSTPSPSPTPTVTPSPTPSTPGPLLYKADWSHGMDGWNGSSSWQVVDGEMVYQGNNQQQDTIIAPYQPATADYAVEAQIKLLSQWTGYSWYGCVARADSSRTGYSGIVYGDNQGNSTATIQPFFPERVPYTIDSNWHTFLLEVKGTQITFFIDGNKVVGPYDDTSYTSAGQVGLLDETVKIEVKSFAVYQL